MSNVQRVRDTAVAVGAAAVDTLLFSRLTEDPKRIYWVHHPVPVTVVLAAGALLVPALLVRRRAPVPVLLAVAVYAAVTTVTIGSRPLMSLAVTVFTVASSSSRRVSLWCLVPVGTAQGLEVAYEVSGLPAPQRALDAVLVATLFLLVDGAAWGLGTWAGWTIRQRVLISERAAADAAARERASIAHDMHDVVAHAVTLMLLQAAGAERMLGSDPQRAREALAQVDTLGHQAIVELRRMLHVIGDDDRQRAPAVESGLADLPDLIRQTLTDRVHVDLAVTGTPRTLEPGVDLSAFRIMQEALTNATRYAAAGQPVRVAVTWSATDVELTIRNHLAHGSRAAITTLSGGFGLTGMRERAAAVGGRVDAGPRPDGTFLVQARLPLLDGDGRSR